METNSTIAYTVPLGGAWEVYADRGAANATNPAGHAAPDQSGESPRTDPTLRGKEWQHCGGSRFKAVKARQMAKEARAEAIVIGSHAQSERRELVALEAQLAEAQRVLAGPKPTLNPGASEEQIRRARERNDAMNAAREKVRQLEPRILALRKRTVRLEDRASELNRRAEARESEAARESAHYERCRRRFWLRQWTGRWTTTCATREQPMTLVATLTRRGERLVGTYAPTGGRLEVTKIDHEIQGRWTVAGQHGGFTWALSADGKSFTGAWQHETGGSGAWSGRRE